MSTPAAKVRPASQHDSVHFPRPAQLNHVSPVAAHPAALQRALTQPQSARPSDILALQRTCGNQAVQQLLLRHAVQAKLTVGPAGDHYEQEADRVADQVMRLPPLPATPSSGRVQGSTDEQDEVQAKPLAGSITPLVQRQAEEEEVRAKPDIQRQAEEEDDEIQAKPVGPGAAFEANQSVEDELRAAKGGGQPLPPDLRAYLEPRFGADFSGVRVHTDSQAAQLNRQLSAQAFTHGRDIYLPAQSYAPASGAGQRLLAHELTHVIQQAGAPAIGRVQRKGRNIPEAGDMKEEAGAGFRLFSTSLYGKILQAVAAYHALDDEAYDAQMQALIQIGELIVRWEGRHGPTSQKNTGRGAWLPWKKSQQRRREVLNKLKPRVAKEQDLVSHQQQLPGMRRRLEERFKASPDFHPETFFAEKNVKSVAEKKGGQLNPELQEITYKHGWQTKGGLSKQLSDREFKGYFKYQVNKDVGYGKHRGTATGIPEMNPRFMERSLATYKLDQLLGANVIAPTFAAPLKGKKGYIQQSIQGKTGREVTGGVLDPFNVDWSGDRGGEALTQALAKLYLLDIVCAQVDRHEGNFIVTFGNKGEFTGVKGIDNDLAFGEKYSLGVGGQKSKIAGKTLAEIPIERALAQRIIALAKSSELPDILTKTLGGLLTEGEIKATVTRLLQLKDRLENILKKATGNEPVIFQTTL